VVFGQRLTFGTEDERVTAVAVGFGKRAVDGDGVAATLERKMGSA
jgi:hypothetical protein